MGSSGQPAQSPLGTKTAGWPPCGASEVSSRIRLLSVSISLSASASACAEAKALSFFLPRHRRALSAFRRFAQVAWWAVRKAQLDVDIAVGKVTTTHTPRGALPLKERSSHLGGT